jgi:hypothetical protein
MTCAQATTATQRERSLAAHAVMVRDMPESCRQNRFELVALHRQCKCANGKLSCAIVDSSVSAPLRSANGDPLP